MDKKSFAKLDPKAFGLSCGIIGAVMLFLMTLFAVFGVDYGLAFLKMVESVYPGYAISGLGVIVGTVYGFLDGFIGGYIFAWLYNKLA